MHNSLFHVLSAHVQGAKDFPSLFSGIIRNRDCSYQKAWQAYKCGPGYSYHYLAFESMDSDSESRRLSPVAIASEGVPGGDTVDLINGPQDHGWCHGYTCQKRVSAFSAIVAAGEKI